MKLSRTILMILILTATTGIYGQKINAKGKKMVSRIESFLYDDKKPYKTIDFHCAPNTELSEMIFDAPASRKIVFKKSGNTLTRTEYDYTKDGKEKKYLRFSYTFNNEGYISSKTRDSKGLDGSVGRWVWEYCYDDNYRLAMVNHKFFYKGNGLRTFEEREGDRIHRHFLWDENGNILKRLDPCLGNCVWGEDNGNNHIRWYNDEIKYYDLLNDTNINFYSLVQDQGGEEHFEHWTEWVNMNPRNLVQTAGCYRFEYVYDGIDKRNISKVIVYERDRKKYEFRVTYLR